MKNSFNKNIFRLQDLTIILVVKYHLFYVISCVAEVCLSCIEVKQNREENEWNCYIYNFDRVTHKLSPQSTWLFYRKIPTICRKDFYLSKRSIFVEKTLIVDKNSNCRKEYNYRKVTNIRIEPNWQKEQLFVDKTANWRKELYLTKRYQVVESPELSKRPSLTKRP